MAVGDVPGSSTTLSGRLTFGGLASGLDTNSLVRTLLAIEAQPLNRLEARKGEVEREQELFRELNTKLLALRNAARDIDNRVSTLPSVGGESNSEELLAFTATSTDDSLVTASASGDAVPGTYEVVVKQLATAGREISTGVADADASLGFGGETLDIDYGDATSVISVSLNASTTLNELASAINADANNGGNVTATVLDDGTDFHLVLQGTETGTENDLTITESAGLAGFIDPALSSDAQDSIVNVLGIDVTRASNSVTDAVAGITFELQDADAATTVEVTVAEDVDTIATRLEALTSAYNDVRQFIRTNASFDPDSETAGALSGDSTVRFIDGLVQQTLINSFQFTEDSEFQGLAEIGISTGANGDLSVDRSALESALQTDAQAVRRLIGGDPANGEDGAATALARALGPIVRSGDGLLVQREQGFETRIDDLDLRIEQLERLLVIREERLISQFTALESTLVSLQTQESFLRGI